MSQWYRSEERRKELKEERLKKEKAERAAGLSSNKDKVNLIQNLQSLQKVKNLHKKKVLLLIKVGTERNC